MPGLAARCRNLSVQYGGVSALRSITMDVRKAEVIGLLGRSGSGKSTLAAALHGPLPLGAKRVAGSVECFAGTALVPQDPLLAFSPFLSLGSQVSDCLPQGERSAGAGRRTVVEWFARLGLPNPDAAFDAYLHQLSGGQIQRVAWAQAFVQQPGLLLADEPTTALDCVLQREVAGLAANAVRETGMAMVWVSHDAALLRQVAQEVVVIADGRIVERGAAVCVLSRPRSAEARELLESAL